VSSGKKNTPGRNHFSMGDNVSPKPDSSRSIWRLICTL